MRFQAIRFLWSRALEQRVNVRKARLTGPSNPREDKWR